MSVSNYALSAHAYEPSVSNGPAVAQASVGPPIPRVLLIIGGEQRELTPAVVRNAQTLGDLVRLVRESAEGQDWFICGMEVDHTRVDDRSNAWTAVHLSAARTVHIQVESQRALLQQALEQASTSVSKARSEFVDAAWGLRLEEPEALVTLANAAESLQIFTPFLATAQQLVVDDETRNALRSFHSRLATAARVVTDAQGAKDNLAVADSIESELVPALESWVDCEPQLKGALLGG